MAATLDEIWMARDKARAATNGIGEPIVELPSGKIYVIDREGKKVLCIGMRDLISLTSSLLDLYPIR